MARGSMQRNSIQMDAAIARAAARDAGNRSMRAAGRDGWNQTDWNAAAAEYERLWPAETKKEEN